MVSVKPKVTANKTAKLKQSDKIEKIKRKNVKTIPVAAAPVSNKQKVTEEKKKVILEKRKVKPVADVAKKYVMPTKAVTENIVNSCLKALLNVVVSQDKVSKDIFDDEKPIFAEVHCIKIQNVAGNVKFHLPHSTLYSTGEVCLVTPDIKKGRKHDHEPAMDHWEEILKKAGVTQVKTILPMRQLRVEYDQYELKRRMLTQHDFIMVDSRVLSHVSHILGKMFFKKHNMLIPVRLHGAKDIKKSIDAGLRTAIMRLGEGETSTVTIGHTAMPHKKIKENILAFVNQLENRYPGGQANVRSISIKLPLSVSLPVYVTLRPSNTVFPPKLTHKKPKHYTVLEDELSTMPGRVVRVAPDGTVKLKKLDKQPENSEEIMDEDENEE